MLYMCSSVPDSNTPDAGITLPDDKSITRVPIRQLVILALGQETCKTLCTHAQDSS